MESQDVRLARLEEGMVSVKGDTRYIRDRFDNLSLRVLTASGSISVITTVLTALAVKAIMGAH